MREALIYSLKVWLTTAVFGMRAALIIRICLDKDHLLYRWSDIFASAIYDIPVGIIACVPSFFLFAWIAYALRKTKATIVRIKFLLTVIAVILSILPFAIVFTHQLFSVNYLPDMLPDLFGYIIITILGLWLYGLRINNIG